MFDLPIWIQATLYVVGMVVLEIPLAIAVGRYLRGRQ